MIIAETIIWSLSHFNTASFPIWGCFLPFLLYLSFLSTPFLPPILSVPPLPPVSCFPLLPSSSFPNPTPLSLMLSSHLPLLPSFFFLPFPTASYLLFLPGIYPLSDFSILKLISFLHSITWLSNSSFPLLPYTSHSFLSCNLLLSFFSFSPPHLFYDFYTFFFL